MASAVIHLPRVAWDGARAFVASAGSDDFPTFAEQLGNKLGTAFHHELAATRQRLLTARVDDTTDEHAAYAEIGNWRMRLDDLLRRSPQLTDAVRELIAQAPGNDGPEPTGRN
jgi:hypothetical protein